MAELIVLTIGHSGRPVLRVLGNSYIVGGRASVRDNSNIKNTQEQRASTSRTSHTL